MSEWIEAILAGIGAAYLASIALELIFGNPRNPVPPKAGDDRK